MQMAVNSVNGVKDAARPQSPTLMEPNSFDARIVIRYP